MLFWKQQPGKALLIGCHSSESVSKMRASHSDLSLKLLHKHYGELYLGLAHTGLESMTEA